MSDRLLPLAALMLGGILGCAAPRGVTTGRLLAEMTDLGALVEWPNPPFTCRQSSSYDRASVTPADPETWFANTDVNQYIRVDDRDGRKERVMMEADGPGAIVRIWSANPKGTLRVYLDHSPEPILAVPMADFLSGKAAGVPEPIAHVRARGYNCYLPIPYARHCLVTSDEDGFYYHVNYRTYPRGTPIRTFTARDLVALAEQIRQTADVLARPPESAPISADGAGSKRDLTRVVRELAPGEQATQSLGCPGPAAIVSFTARVEASDRDLALRRLLLTLDFDGETTVICPLGDFFGGGAGVAAYESLPATVAADGTLTCRWVMPYRRAARLTLWNNNRMPVQVELQLRTAPYRWTDRTMHFHAGWRAERDYPTRTRSDWNYVGVAGRGVFVGAAFAIANPVKAWWGEGDEKIYVDGEQFPSHFGTGTEDYFGYAWCCPELFTHAYHNQPRCDGPGNYGRTAVNRWHVLDRIPFERDFRFDMEIWHWWGGHVPEISIATYWYARPGATSNRGVPKPVELALAVLSPYAAYRVPGALEGEEMQIVSSTGTVEPQEIDRCSNDRHLWWRDGRPGERLVLSFDVAAAGRYHVYGRFVEAGDYGIVRLTFNDQPAAELLDLYNKKVTAGAERLLGTIELCEGVNTLAAEIAGCNERALPKYMFGLDYLRLEAVDAQP